MLALFLTSLTRIFAGALVITALGHLWRYWDYRPLSFADMGLIVSIAVLSTDTVIQRMLNRSHP